MQRDEKYGVGAPVRRPVALMGGRPVAHGHGHGHGHDPDDQKGGSVVDDDDDEADGSCSGVSTVPVDSKGSSAAALRTARVSHHPLPASEMTRMGVSADLRKAVRRLAPTLVEWADGIAALHSGPRATST
jgi:hypothetical protein